MDLRTRFAELIGDTLSARAAGRRLKIPASTATRWAKRLETRGHLEPDSMGGKRHSKLDGSADELIGRVLEQPDISLSILQDELAEKQVVVDVSTLSYFLKREGFSLKKNAAGKRTPRTAPSPGPTDLA